MSRPLPTNPMSQTSPVIPPSKFQSTFRNALQAYNRRTREDLLLHPLATRLRSCDSSDAILSVLQEQAQAIDPSWNGDEKLAMWLGQSVDVLYALSSSLEEGVGLVIIGVSSPAKVIFVGISILLSAAHSVHANQDGLINIFRRMDNLFQRLRAYTVVPPPQSSKDLNEEIMLTRKLHKGEHEST
ncbi:hypothetical protein DFH94DRAFT_841602 [Russula ochroleuca]|uniref:Fungal STAND N-terminal Goodbye domain-containing protein n=1 Tax=Russula ochroleuca TaxID=152965 RepID=A0A9P5TEM3_9AGAM|nr:hypothetical protein DFH94DRAFT_841602 [Russula ochroleuca]